MHIWGTRLISCHAMRQKGLSLYPLRNVAERAPRNSRSRPEPRSCSCSSCNFGCAWNLNWSEHPEAAFCTHAEAEAPPRNMPKYLAQNFLAEVRVIVVA